MAILTLTITVAPIIAVRILQIILAMIVMKKKKKKKKKLKKWFHLIPQPLLLIVAPT